MVIDAGGRPLGVHRVWPLLVFRGALMAALGVATLVWPALTATALIVMFGIFLLLDGIAAIALGLARRKQRRGGGGWFGQGVFATVAGLVAIIWPDIAAYVVLLFLAFSIVILSVVLFGVGLAMRAARSRYWGWPVGFAWVGIVMSILLTVNPSSGVLGFTTLLGVFLTIGGVALVAGGLEVRRSITA